jgi:hypothetical protein
VARDGEVITPSQARQIALRKIESIGSDLVLLDDETIKKPYGWFFFYGEKAFRGTGGIPSGVVANAPFLVKRSDGSIRNFREGRSVEEYITAYERDL